MTISIRSLSLIVLSLALASCASSPGGGRSLVIEGVVLDGEVPISQAEIKINPQGETQVVGIAVSNAAGRFTIVALANTELFTEEPLRKDTTYEARIQVPGYYILEKTFEYSKGTESWEFALELRAVDDLGDATTFNADDPDAPPAARTMGGSVRRTSR